MNILEVFQEIKAEERRTGRLFVVWDGPKWSSVDDVIAYCEPLVARNGGGEFARFGKNNDLIGHANQADAEHPTITHRLFTVARFGEIMKAIGAGRFEIIRHDLPVHRLDSSSSDRPE